MKKNIISALVIFFVVFAILLVASEVSKSNEPSNQLTQSYDLNE